MGTAAEEFTLFRHYDGGDERAKASNFIVEKKNWMSSVQLFTPISTNQDSVFHLTSVNLNSFQLGNMFLDFHYLNSVYMFVFSEVPRRGGQWQWQ